MAKRRGTRPTFRYLEGRWRVVALAGTFVLAGALVAAALAATQPVPVDDSVPPASFDLIEPAPVATVDVEPIASPTRVLAAVNDLGAWRAPVGACPGTPAALEYTTDGGATWKPSTSAGTAGMTAILSLDRGDDGRAEAVGLVSEACTPRLFTTIARADRWEPAAGVETEWYVVPGDPSRVNSPGGIRATPCAVVVGVQTMSDESAGVLCDDHRFFRTQNGGASWDGGIVLRGARAFAESSDGYLVAAVAQPGCDGVQLQLVYPQAAPRDGAAAGCRITTADTTEVSISVVGDTVWLWTGDEISVTVDRGATWN